MAWCNVEGSAADVPDSNTGESISIRSGVVGVGGELDAFVKHAESGLLVLDALELLLDAIENHTDSGLLRLDGEQTILQAMLAGEQAVLQAMLARKQEAGESDAGGDDCNQLGGHGLHERIVPNAAPPEPPNPGRGA